MPSISSLDKFDKQRKYVTKWVPEFENEQYVKPIVLHKEMRLRALERYKAAIN